MSKVQEKILRYESSKRHLLWTKPNMKSAPIMNIAEPDARMLCIRRKHLVEAPLRSEGNGPSGEVVTRVNIDILFDV